MIGRGKKEGKERPAPSGANSLRGEGEDPRCEPAGTAPGIPAKPARRDFLVGYIRFSVVGLSNGVVDYGTLNLLMLLFPTRHPVLLASYNVIALILANANSYVWNSRWTFRGRSDRSTRELLLFSSQAALNILVAGGVIWGVSSLLFADTRLPSLVVGDTAKVTSSVVATTLSFLVLRYVVFRERPREERTPVFQETTTPPCRSPR